MKRADRTAPPRLLQVPGRLHITWQDDNTLRLDTDSGTQTRLFRFGGSPPPNAAPSWQGHSVAMWGGGEPRDRRDGLGGPAQDPTGRLVVIPAQRKEADYLKVTTTRMRPGYLQKNGVPYSGNALLEEYFDLFSDPYTKNTWLVVTRLSPIRNTSSSRSSCMRISRSCRTHRGGIPRRVAPTNRGEKGYQMRATILLFALLVLLAGAANAQFAFAPPAVDLTGEWAPRVYNTHMDIGDYTGMPLNEEGRLRAQSWHPDQLDLPENLCRPHPIDHGLRVSVSQLRITNELDPETRQPVGLRLHVCLAGARAGDLHGWAAASIAQCPAQVVGILDRTLGAQYARLPDDAPQGGVSLAHRRAQEHEGRR